MAALGASDADKNASPRTTPLDEALCDAAPQSTQRSPLDETQRGPLDESHATQRTPLDESLCVEALPAADGEGGTAMQKLRIVTLTFGTARQKRVLE